MNREKNKQEDCINFNDFQKELVTTLEYLGFEWKYFTTWSGGREFGHRDINVAKVDDLVTLIDHFYNDGKDQKRFEMLRVLGL